MVEWCPVWACVLWACVLWGRCVVAPLKKGTLWAVNPCLKPDELCVFDAKL
ncbi:hypothetical protein DPMN_153531 [Dreissena polymorpha]|uniref:Uncharacterized protein n=1 Tax=Dreissena polymorpha TaxID=45954 RepID=A0A9D4J8C5_DREPO|nr:hypothetical protein DPMN_153531 [Dreissena polymorpha]